MNERILHIIKSPGLLKVSDIGELKREISNYPYVQPIRALYLMALHQFQPEDYQKELALTAAYTTDKKILYQLVNPIPVAVAEKQPAEKETPPEEVPVVKETEEVPVVMPEPTMASEPEQAEETVLPEPEEIFSQKDIKEEIHTPVQEEPVTASEEIKSETAEPEIIEAPAETVETATTEEDEFAAQTSFSGTDHFLPDVKFNVPDNHTEYAGEKKPSVVPGFRHSFVSTFTQPIITDKTAEDKSEEENIDHSKLDFSGNTHFDFLDRAAEAQKLEDRVKEPLPVEEEPFSEKEAVIEAVVPVVAEEKVADLIQITDKESYEEWTPMSFDLHIPDALIGKQPDAPVIETEAPKSEQPEHNIPQEAQPETVVQKEEEEVEKQTIETVSENKKGSEERPVINYSFFGADHKNETDKVVEEQMQEEIVEEVNVVTEDEPKAKVQSEKPAGNVSNVSSFINTWQNWLHKEKPENLEEERKNKAIEKFIENNPRISSLKDESDYVIKDKGDDISHLMTETLANLYLGQRLYSKAINAFEILKKKFPEKEKELQEKINYIKDLKSGKIQSED
ncbi:hypothetical protein [Elizabethkingia meningoseptica]|uniref:hypothetical protein n=1 Tax=Elizabethkingia meningoseptica TaxID=238 RepID=UPI003019CAFF